MQILLYFVVVLHVIVCLFLIGVVLLQQGRSADLAGAFGGQGSQTAFGPRAAANVLTRLTTWSAIIFMFTSISLTVLYQRSTGAPTRCSRAPAQLRFPLPQPRSRRRPPCLCRASRSLISYPLDRQTAGHTACCFCWMPESAVASSSSRRQRCLALQ